MKQKKIHSLLYGIMKNLVDGFFPYLLNSYAESSTSSVQTNRIAYDDADYDKLMSFTPRKKRRREEKTLKQINRKRREKIKKLGRYNESQDYERYDGENNIGVSQSAAMQVPIYELEEGDNVQEFHALMIEKSKNNISNNRYNTRYQQSVNEEQYDDEDDFDDRYERRRPRRHQKYVEEEQQYDDQDMLNNEHTDEMNYSKSQRRGKLRERRVNQAPKRDMQLKSKPKIPSRSAPKAYEQITNKYKSNSSKNPLYNSRDGSKYSRRSSYR